MVEHFAPEAIRQLHPIERTALLKRSFRPKPALTITWGITRGLHSQKPMIVGTRNTESMFYDGPVADASKVVWFGQSIPPSVIQQYADTFSSEDEANHSAAVNFENVRNSWSR